MKQKIDNNKYFYWGLTIFSIVAFAILFFFLLYRWENITGGLIKFLKIFTPFGVGFIIAYLLNPIIKYMESRVFNKLGKKVCKKEENAYKFSRFASIIVSTLILVLILVGFFSFIIPEILRSIDTMIANIPDYLNNIESWILTAFENKPELEELILDNYDDIYDYIISYINSGNIPSVDSIIGNISNGLVTIFKAIYNIVLGYIVAIYLLLGKEKFLAQAKKLLYTVVKPNKAFIILDNLRYTDKIFGGFLIGKMIDSLIIGIICFAFMLLLNMPYPLLLAVIVGVTNIIPYFGPIIGAVPCALLILLVSPSKCLTFIIFIIILQQFDGNVLGPKILGNKTGLQSFWVLFSIIVFGGLFGFIGMLFGVPLFAIIYSFFNGVCERRLAACELPLATDDYKKINYIDPETNKPVYYPVK